MEQSGAGGGAAWWAAPATEKMAKMERRIRVAVDIFVGGNEVVFLVGKGSGDDNGSVGGDIYIVVGRGKDSSWNVKIVERDGKGEYYRVACTRSFWVGSDRTTVGL